jgi:endonuclease/exonuclease/phosphatase family metal-dependent hydrolase
MVRTNSCKLAVEMLNKIRGDAQLPVVVAGDWNMGLTDTGYAVVTQSGYPDVRIKAEHTEYGGSFNAWGDRADDNFAYGDHIFMSENMAAEVYDVVDDYYDGVHISDHCPLYAVLYY